MESNYPHLTTRLQKMREIKMHRRVLIPPLFNPHIDRRCRSSKLAGVLELAFAETIFQQHVYFKMTDTTITDIKELLDLLSSHPSLVNDKIAQSAKINQIKASYTVACTILYLQRCKSWIQVD